jgi:glycosyltransferase involved in cell wall biosynthesis
MKKKLLFFIPTLGGGGAEKGLVTLLNLLDRSKYEIELLTLFKGGANSGYLKPDIKHRYVFPFLFKGYTRLLKVLSPALLCKCLVRRRYDVLIAYLEGIPTRVFGGCPDPAVKKIAWIHVEMDPLEEFYRPFRSRDEFIRSHRAFDRVIGVTNSVVRSFIAKTKLDDLHFEVCPNPIDARSIQNRSNEGIRDIIFPPETFILCAVGRLTHQKGFDRLLAVIRRLRNDCLPVKFHLYIFGVGKLEGMLRKYIRDNALHSVVTLAGYKDNPGKYVKRADLFVCSSYTEGLSHAVFESVIVGTPVITTRCSGMEEILGDDECGMIVENNEDALYDGVRSLLLDRGKYEQYRRNAAEGKKLPDMRKVVSAIEALLDTV